MTTDDARLKLEDAITRHARQRELYEEARVAASRAVPSAALAVEASWDCVQDAIDVLLEVVTDS